MMASCKCGQFAGAAARARAAASKGSAASRKASRLATQAANKAVKGCPSGGCHGKRAVIVAKKVSPTKAKPCNC